MGCIVDDIQHNPASDRSSTYDQVSRHNSTEPTLGADRPTKIRIEQQQATCQLDPSSRQLSLSCTCFRFAEHGLTISPWASRCAGCAMVTKVAVTPSTPSVFIRNNPLWISKPRVSVPTLSLSHIRRNHFPSYGVTTPAPDFHHHVDLSVAKCPFILETGYALCAKRSPRPFPPPFLALPTSSFSDPLTSPRGQDKRLSVRGELIRGLNNGDDAVLAGETFMGVNDGVGAWATKPQGHAA